MSKSQPPAGISLTELEVLCGSWPGVTRDLKWRDHLAFCVCGKTFVIAPADGREGGHLAFKVADERFLELTDQPGVIPPPYWRVHAGFPLLSHRVSVRPNCRCCCWTPMPRYAQSCRRNGRPNSARFPR